jgi:hypothetical protein
MKLWSLSRDFTDCEVNKFHYPEKTRHSSYRTASEQVEAWC